MTEIHSKAAATVGQKTIQDPPEYNTEKQGSDWLGGPQNGDEIPGNGGNGGATSVGADYTKHRFNETPSEAARNPQSGIHKTTDAAPSTSPTQAEPREHAEATNSGWLPLSQLLQPYAAKWTPVPSDHWGVIDDGSNDAKTLGEWLSDPRLEPYLNTMVFFEGPCGDDSGWAGYTVLETFDTSAGLLWTPNPWRWNS